MSVVTAVRNVSLAIPSCVVYPKLEALITQFIRLLGGTFSLAIGATIMYVLNALLAIHDAIKDLLCRSNNSLRSAMAIYRLPTSTVNKIVDNPTLLGQLLSSSNSSGSDSLASLGVSPPMAAHILDGYTHGFRIVFILNASLAAVAVVASVLMIRHKELTRDDEAKLKQEARAKDESAPDVEKAPISDAQEDAIELEVLDSKASAEKTEDTA